MDNITPSVDTPPAPTQVKVIEQIKMFDWTKVPQQWKDKYGETNLAKFHHYLEKLECQDLVITWNYNYAVSSCLGRKVWLGNGEDFPIYANLYLIIVGPPAASKSLPSTKMTQVLKSLVDYKLVDGKMLERKLVNIFPDSVTIESLYDRIAEATSNFIVPGPPPNPRHIHASASFCLAEEIGVLFREKTNDLIMFLTAGWNCGDFTRKIKSEAEVVIVNMCINFLGCCTPKWYRENMSSKLINEGFTGRVLHIFCNSRRQTSKSLDPTIEGKASLESLKFEHLKKLCKIAGEVKFTPEALEFIDDWCVNKWATERINNDSKVEFYYARKRHHLKKLCIVAHFHNNLDMLITIDDVKLAMKMLLEIEPLMHLALQTEVTNKLSKLASMMLTYVTNSKQCLQQHLIREHFDSGDLDEIQKAIDYLKNNGDIYPIIINGKPGFSLVEPSNES